VYLLAGGAVGYVASSSYSYKSPYHTTERDYVTDGGKVDLSAAVGAGIGSRQGSPGSFLEARFYFGLNMLLPNSRFHLFQILAGYRFPLARHRAAKP
jgi:hypothetical protein